MDTSSIILKRDTRGRVRTPVERQRALVDEFRQSGLSAMKFAALVGVRYNTFWTWLHKHGEDGAPARPRRRRRRQHFVELALGTGLVQTSGQGRALCLTLPGGASLRLEHRVQVGLAAELLKALSVPC